ncbi:MAG: hypothetical protein Q4A15_09650 [Prevotellaceae bacterium]|nr:hypothetical protein [Prevotellaceae bacterium]
MEYYLFEVAKGDPKIEGKAVITYQTEDEAIGNFHSHMGTAMKSELYDYDLCIVVDSNGAIYENKKYERAKK